jgi:hypothetical protein
VRITTLAFAVRSSPRQSRQCLPTRQQQLVIPASASPRRLAVGSLFSLGSSVFLCALSLLSWFYYHPVVVATRIEKRSIQ